jgi:prefoldin subunit 5
VRCHQRSAVSVDGPKEIVERCATDDIRNMTDERIQKIKSAVEAADHISPEKKTELLAVLAKLKPAIAEVAQTSEEEAESISRFVEASAHKVANRKERPESVEKVLHKLKQTVEKFEASHPQLTAFVTEYSAVLSGLGI